jgi:SAM-dependent methyltransferase
LQELSWPAARDFTGETGASYRASAQVFVSELLRLPEGDACFRNLLIVLPRYFNWQTAFLQAFHAYFERLLDLEKWWSLQSVAFAGGDPGRTWSVAESWQKLDEALRERAASPLRVLEVGCGIGTMLERLLDYGWLCRAVYRGIDLQEENIREAASRLEHYAAASGAAISKSPGALLYHSPTQQVAVELEAVDLDDFLAREGGGAEV